jgi:hypothetical protein
VFVALVWPVAGHADDLTVRVKRAVKRSTLDQAGTRPFHLKAVLAPSCPRDKDSGRTGEVEIWWASPTRWKREVRSPEFQQIVIVNGNQRWRKNEGDYFPEWLRETAIALIKPVPPLQQVLGQIKDGDVRRMGQMIHASWTTNSGTADVHNVLNSVVALQDTTGLLLYAGGFGWDGEFKDYKSYHGRMVARTVSNGSPEVTANVLVLENLGRRPAGFFNAQAGGGDPLPLRTKLIDETTLRKNLLPTEPIVWPVVEDGALQGNVTTQIVVDREGKVREIGPMVSENSSLDSTGKAAVANMRFKPFLVNGMPVQVMSQITMPFKVVRSTIARTTGAQLPSSKEEASKYPDLDIQGNISKKDLTEIRVSRFSMTCGPGLYSHWPMKGIYRISGDTAAWGKVEPADLHFYAIAAPSNANVLYQDRGPRDPNARAFSRSEDGGKSWTTPKFQLLDRPSDPGETANLDFALQAISPSEPLTVFATVVTSPALTKDPDRWSRYKLLAFPRYKLLGLYVSKDGGDTWAPFYSKITGMVFNSRGLDTSDTPDHSDHPLDTAAFALAPSNPSVMYGYADGDIAKSIDAGRTWIPSRLKSMSRDRVLANCAKVEFSNKFAFTSKPIPDSGNYRGEDAGFRDYYLRQLGLPRQKLSQIIVDPTNENIVYVVAEIGIYRTMDGGKNWTLFDLGFEGVDGIHGIAINQNDPAQIFAGTVEGLYVSHDRGDHFEKIAVPPDALQCVDP